MMHVGSLEEQVYMLIFKLFLDECMNECEWWLKVRNVKLCAHVSCVFPGFVWWTGAQRTGEGLKTIVFRILTRLNLWKIKSCDCPIFFPLRIIIARNSGWFWTQRSHWRPWETWRHRTTRIAWSKGAQWRAWSSWNARHSGSISECFDWISKLFDEGGSYFSSLQGRDTSDQHIVEVVLKMLQGEFPDRNN